MINFLRSLLGRAESRERIIERIRQRYASREEERNAIWLDAQKEMLGSGWTTKEHLQHHFGHLVRPEPMKMTDEELLHKAANLALDEFDAEQLKDCLELGVDFNYKMNSSRIIDSLHRGIEAMPDDPNDRSSPMYLIRTEKRLIATIDVLIGAGFNVNTDLIGHPFTPRCLLYFLIQQSCSEAVQFVLNMGSSRIVRIEYEGVEGVEVREESAYDLATHCRDNLPRPKMARMSKADMIVSLLR